MDFKNKFYYMLAPLEDMTDSCFRTLCYRHGADLAFTELVYIEGLARNNQCTWSRIKLYDDTPTVIQIIGEREPSLKKFLSRFEPQNGFMGFNLNLGCPAPAAVHNGAGCAMIKRIAKTNKIIDIIKKKGYTVNIKLRLGLNQFEKDKKVYLNLIKNTNADFYVVHARHGNQTYKDKADWSIFPECAKTGKNIIANGDIKTKEDAETMKSFGCKGVMIGRQAIKNPTIFAQLKGLAVPSKEELEREYKELFKQRDPPLKYMKNVFKHIDKNVVFENPG